MTDRTIDLDDHRGMAAQKRRTELRRLLADVAANETALRLRQEELETQVVAAPATNWHEAAEKARYLLNLFAGTLTPEDRRRQRLIAAVLADFDRLVEQAGAARRILPRNRYRFIGSTSGVKWQKGPNEKNPREKEAEGRQEQGQGPLRRYRRSHPRVSPEFIRAVKAADTGMTPNSSAATIRVLRSCRSISPNRSRCYDATLRAVRFWGHDGPWRPRFS